MQPSRTELSQQIEELKLQLAKLIQQLYGRRNERVVDDPNQRRLDSGDAPPGAGRFGRCGRAEQFVEGYLMSTRYGTPRVNYAHGSARTENR